MRLPIAVDQNHCRHWGQTVLFIVFKVLIIVKRTTCHICFQVIVSSVSTRNLIYFWCYCFGLLITLAERHCVNFYGLTYSGEVSVSQQNIPCQRWDLQHPHIHVHTDPSMFPDHTLADAANYCRAPNGNGWLWCYTTSVEQRWDYCDFEMTKRGFWLARQCCKDVAQWWITNFKWHFEF